MIRARKDVQDKVHTDRWSAFRDADYPALNVTWDQARAFCAWTGGRLPTEAEWERAARGRFDTRRFPWGDQDADCSLANHKYPSGPMFIYCEFDTNAVGSYSLGGSPDGLLDAAGNVWEWVQDWYQWDYYSVSPGSNPPGPDSGGAKVLRGGAWNETQDALFVFFRNHAVPSTSSHSVGFRCARTP